MSDTLPAGRPEITPNAPPAMKRWNLTDVGNSQRFALQHQGWARYVWEWKSWLLWTGTHWRRDAGDGPMRFAKATARGIYHEIASTASPEERERIAKWAIQSESERRLQAMLTLAQSEPGIPVRPAALDTDPWLLNVLNGTLDLRTGELRPHQREDLLTKIVPVAYEPQAECPLWQATLDRILASKRHLVAYLQCAMGYSLTGLTTEQVIFIFWGIGANGKTTVLTTAVTMLGDYAMATRPETLMVKKGDAIPNDVARLHGARMVIAVEADPGQRLAEGTVKQMTGGDVLTARFMRAEFFDFVPTFKLFLATNHRPVIRGSDHAIWRRIRLVPFTVTIPDSEQDRQLAEKLRAEWPGILAWAVQGCLAWQRDGLGLPDEIRSATSDYRADMDALGAFILERCRLEPEARIGARDLYQAYEGWGHTSGEPLLKERTFSLRLAERGLTKKSTKKGKVWLGIRLRSVLDPDEPLETVTDRVTVTDGDGFSRLIPSCARTENQPETPVTTRHPSPGDQEVLPGWITEDEERA